MYFEELKIMTDNKNFVINVIEKRLIERNVSYVKINYDGYTEFHFLDFIYRLSFLDLEKDMCGKYEVLNKIMNSVNSRNIDVSQDIIFSNIDENNCCINMMNYEEPIQDKKTGYKKYRKKEDRNFNKQKVNVKSKFNNNFYRRK